MLAMRQGAQLAQQLEQIAEKWPQLSPAEKERRLKRLAPPSHQLPPAVRAHLAAAAIHTFSMLLSTPPPSGDAFGVERVHIAMFESLSRLVTGVSLPARKSMQVAHVVHELLQTVGAGAGAALSLRLSALNALFSVSEACGFGVRAALLPGVVSRLCALLSHAKHVQGVLVMAAFRVLSLFVDVLDVNPLLSNTSPSSFSDALRQRTQRDAVPNGAPAPHSSDAPNVSMNVKRDHKWVSNAANNFSMHLLTMVYSHHGPLSHARADVRVAFTNLITNVLSLRSFRRSDQLFVSFSLSLLALCADTFQAVSRSAAHAIRSLSSSGSELCRRLLGVFRAIAAKYAAQADDTQLSQSCSNAVQRFFSYDDERLQMCVHGMLSTLFPLRHEDAVLELRRLPSFLSSLGHATFASILCDLHQHLFVAPPIPSPPSLDHQSYSNVSSEAAFRMGKAECVYTIMPQLLHIAASAVTFDERAHCALVLSALLRGALTATSDLAVLKAVEELFIILNDFFLPAFDDVSSSAVQASDRHIAIKMCLLQEYSYIVQLCSDLCARCQRSLPTRLVLLSIMSLLCDAAHGEHLVRPFAKGALTTVASRVGCPSLRALVHRHLNYIVSRLLNNLSEQWATDVLIFIVAEPDILNEDATSMVHKSLAKLCDSLAGVTDQRALQVLPAVQTVLSTALIQIERESVSDVLKSAEDPVEVVGISDADRAQLRKTILRYSEEEVMDYEKLTREPDTPGEYDDVSSDNSHIQSPFEGLAQDTLTSMRDILVGRSWKLRAEALACATLAVKLLGHRRKLLLPHAAKLLPLLPQQFLLLNEDQLSAGERLFKAFKKKKLRGRTESQRVEDLVETLNRKGAELPIVTNACKLLSALARCAGSFIQDRFIRLIYPNLVPLLQLAQSYPTLIASTASDATDSLVTPPSYGAMAASDACLEALASIASSTPIVLSTYTLSFIKYLVVFFDQRNDPLRSPRRKIIHVNRSMVRYESERWIRRERLANQIVRQLKKVNPEDVLVGLLSYDPSAPDVIKPRDPSLHPIRVNAIRPR
eukprot:TRINITY_DN1160_c0_g2_i1.p1 TRINITY_DN1160_c0_g2~~TRINITY_DN1160_c0_g2_i1.p1  ORF type:complete len:1047 (+),score=188.48 TRINITY_DN1160_c0_g2_i1:7662-10802(+)